MKDSSFQLLPSSNLLTQASTRTLTVVRRADAPGTDGTEDDGFFAESLTSTLLACTHTRARAYTHTHTHTHTVREEGGDRERARGTDGERETNNTRIHSSELMSVNNYQLLPTRTFTKMRRSEARGTGATGDSNFLADSLAPPLLACTHTHTHTHTHSEWRDKERARKRKRPTTHAYTHPD